MMSRAIAGMSLLLAFTGAEAALPVELECPAVPPANTLYVALTGADNNPGTCQAPLASLRRAAELAVPGTTVWMRQGTYRPLRGQWLGASGTATARIRYQPHPGEGVVLDGSDTPTDTTLVTLSGEYIDFEGFVIRRASKTGLSVWNGRHIRIRNNSLHNNWLGAIRIEGERFSNDYPNPDDNPDQTLRRATTYDVEVSGNFAAYNALMNAPKRLTGGWPPALGSGNARHVHFLNNTVYQTHGEAILFGSTNGGSAIGNTVYDNSSVGIYLDKARFIRVENNRVFSTGDRQYFNHRGEPGNGIAIANEDLYNSNHDPALSTDNVLRNNLVLNTRYGLYYGDFQQGGGLKNSRFEHNTVHNAEVALKISREQSHTQHHNSVVVNNAFSRRPLSSPLAEVQGSGMTYRHNGWYGGSAGAAQGNGDVTALPGFINSDGWLAGDFRLRHDSALRSAGFWIIDPAPLFDYFGNARTAPSSIGFHENDVAQPPTDQKAPRLDRRGLNVGVDGDRIALWWSAASDNVGISSYLIERNGVIIATTTALSYRDAAIDNDRQYSYRIVALDGAGNRSAWSAARAVFSGGNRPAVFVRNIELRYELKNVNGVMRHIYVPRVQVIDSTNRPVANVRVKASWSGDASGLAEGISDNEGLVRLACQDNEGQYKRSFVASVSDEQVRLTINELSHGLRSYAPASNLESSEVARLANSED